MFVYAYMKGKQYLNAVMYEIKTNNESIFLCVPFSCFFVNNNNNNNNKKKTEKMSMMFIWC